MRLTVFARLFRFRVIGMGEVWKSPRYDLYILLVTIAMFLLFSLLILAGEIPLWPLGVVIFGFLLVYYPLMYLVFRSLLVATYHSQYRKVNCDLSRLMGELEAALKDAGFAPVSRTMRSTYPNWEGLSVGNGLDITLQKAPRDNTLYVGPDRKGTHEDVERLKQVVDDLIGRLEAG